VEDGRLVSGPISGVTAGTAVRVPSQAEQLVYGGEGGHLTWLHEEAHLSRLPPSGSICRALLAETP